jgi:hypothetical protein
MVIFYAGAFGYVSKLNFSNNEGCICGEPTAVKGTLSISTTIPVHEENISSIAGESFTVNKKIYNVFLYGLYVLGN